MHTLITNLLRITRISCRPPPCQGHPFINSQSTIISWIILLEQDIELLTARNGQFMLWRNGQAFFHHCVELFQFYDPVLIGIMVSEDLQHIPIKLHCLSTAWIVDSLLDEVLVLINGSLVNDGMWIHGCSLGSDVLPAELQPFIKGDDPSCLEIHRVEHLLPGSILLRFSFVQIGVSRGISISSWQGSGCINQLGEGGLADKAIFIGVSINKQLQERMVHLSMRMALLVLDSLLYKPDEILLGLVEGVDGSCIRRHD